MSSTDPIPAETPTEAAEAIADEIDRVRGAIVAGDIEARAVPSRAVSLRQRERIRDRMYGLEVALALVLTGRPFPNNKTEEFLMNQRRKETPSE